MLISRTTPISEVWKQAYLTVEPSRSAQQHQLRLVVPGPGTPGGDVLSQTSDEALEYYCTHHFAVLSFREEATDAPARGLVRSSESMYPRPPGGETLQRVSEDQGGAGGAAGAGAGAARAGGAAGAMAEEGQAKE